MAFECLVPLAGVKQNPKDMTVTACPVSTGQAQLSFNTYSGTFSGMLGNNSSASLLDWHSQETTISALLD